jgi:hypothetical protein
MHFRITAAVLFLCVPSILTAGEGKVRRAPKRIANSYIVGFVESVTKHTVKEVAKEVAASKGAKIRHVFVDPIRAAWLEMTEAADTAPRSRR